MGHDRPSAPSGAPVGERTAGVEYKVFIQTNDEQYLGALIAGYALQRNSRARRKGSASRSCTPATTRGCRAMSARRFLRGAEHRVWEKEDLQSFTPLRFTPPKTMGYQGRAVVIDPGLLALGDVWELLTRDMQGKALMCRWRRGLQGSRGLSRLQRHAAGQCQADPLGRRADLP